MPGPQCLGSRPLLVSPDAPALAELPAVSYHHPPVLSGGIFPTPFSFYTYSSSVCLFPRQFLLPLGLNVHHGEHFPDLGEEGGISMILLYFGSAVFRGQHCIVAEG